MTVNDIVNKDGSLNYQTIGGFKDRLDGHDSSLATKANQSDLNSTNSNVSTNTSNIADHLTKLKKIGIVTAYGAVGDGVTDCTSAIQQCINENTVVYFPSGTYITKTITITNRPRIYGAGDGSIIMAHPSASGNIFTVSNGYIIIEKLRIDGNINNVTSTIHGIGDTNQSNALERIRVNDVTMFNLNGNGINFAGRGMDYIIDKVMISCNGYGLYFGTVSDSSVSNSSFASGKAGASFNFSNIRVTGSKFYCCGNLGQYAGAEVNNAGYVSFTGCEFQQNIYDALKFNNSNGNTVTGCIFDSNNQTGLSGQYGAVKLINSRFNRISGSLIDGRFNATSLSPYNITCMYGVVLDDKSCYNNFDLAYSADTYFSNLPRLIPFYTVVKDITTSYKINGLDYFGYTPTVITIGTNATLAGTKSGTVNANASTTPSEIDYIQQASQTCTTDSLFQRLNLNMTQINLTGKTQMYVMFQFKCKSGMSLSLTSSEGSTTTPTTETGAIAITGVNRNTQWMYGSFYMNLSHSNESGYQVNIDISGATDVSGTILNTNDVVYSIKNIQIYAV